MNVQEFTQRTGYTPVSEEEWKAIEKMYMEAGESVDKDLFCKEWMKHGKSDLLRVFYRRATEEAESKRYLKQLCADAAHMLIDKAEYDDTDMYRQAVKLIGQKNVELYKVQNGLELNKEDLEYITDNLQ